jgi:SAM-dependent methyltransferase
MYQGTDEAFWDQMYRRHGHKAWDSEPNTMLSQVVADLAPGAALDMGCGKGADAIWLAQRGWRVTAVDISTVALDRGRAADTAHQVTWLHTDMLAWQPPTDAFDLVSAHYLHIPPAERTAFFGRLAQAVRPKGTLLVVAHHPSDLETTIGRPAIPDLFLTPEEVAASLAPGRWELIFSGTQPHGAMDREGRAVTIQDTVVQARRFT